MTTIILITLWIAYGIFNAYQMTKTDDYTSTYQVYIVAVILSPLLLVYRIIMGLFHIKIYE